MNRNRAGRIEFIILIFVKKVFFCFNLRKKLCSEASRFKVGSAPACIYGTPKMNKFSSSDSFSKLCPIVSSILLIIILPVFFVIFIHP